MTRYPGTRKIGTVAELMAPPEHVMDSDTIARILDRLETKIEHQGSEIQKLKAQQRANDIFTGGLLIILFIFLGSVTAVARGCC